MATTIENTNKAVKVTLHSFEQPAFVTSNQVVQHLYVDSKAAMAEALPLAH